MGELTRLFCFAEGGPKRRVRNIDGAFCAKPAFCHRDSLLFREKRPITFVLKNMKSCDKTGTVQTGTERTCFCPRAFRLLSFSAVCTLVYSPLITYPSAKTRSSQTPRQPCPNGQPGKLIPPPLHRSPT